MPNQLIHRMDAPWGSSNPASLDVSVGSLPDESFAVANRLAAGTGAASTFAEYSPAAPLDLSAFDELRFWIRADRRADGSAARPFYLELSYTDAGDLPGEEHRWFVPVNAPGRWEQRRIGVEHERRSAVTAMRFTCSTDARFTCHVAELLAVREELLIDLEGALVSALFFELPGLTALPLSQPASAGDTEVEVGLAPSLRAQNRVRLDLGTTGSEIHDVTSVTHGATTTTLSFGAGSPLAGDFAAGTGTVTVLAPPIVENPPVMAALPSPAIVITPLDLREDPARSPSHVQRDSFRPRGVELEFSERPAARAYLADYQIVVLAPVREQQAYLQTQVVERLSADVGLWVHGALCPVRQLEPPVLEQRSLGVLAGAYVRIGVRREVAPRIARRRLRTVVIEAGHPDAALPREVVELEL